MNHQEHLEASLKGIRQLLSHLHGELTGLEACYSQVFLVLRELEDRADRDDLTGLLRRRAFSEELQRLLDGCQSSGDSCGLLLLDIDFFKHVNDVFGHPTGDEVIRAVARLLRVLETPGWVIAGRYGGEEFALAMRGTQAEIHSAAELIRQSAERLHGRVLGPTGQPLVDQEWKCTLSVGIATSERAGFDPARLIGAADEALYEAKRRGRNQVRAA